MAGKDISFVDFMLTQLSKCSKHTTGRSYILYNLNKSDFFMEIYVSYPAIERFIMKIESDSTFKFHLPFSHLDNTVTRATL